MRPVTSRLVTAGVNPNILTLAGFSFSLFAAVVLALGHPLIAFLILIAGGPLDALDGKVARDSGRASRFGAFLDSSLDRISETALAVGTAAYFDGLDRLDGALTMWIISGIGLALITSYLRARAEALGFPGEVGWLQRPQRGFLFAAGLATGPLGLHAATVSITLLAGVTVIQRFVHVYRLSRSST